MKMVIVLVLIFGSVETDSKEKLIQQRDRQSFLLAGDIPFVVAQEMKESIRLAEEVKPINSDCPNIERTILYNKHLRHATELFADSDLNEILKDAGSYLDHNCSDLKVNLDEITCNMLVLRWMKGAEFFNALQTGMKESKEYFDQVISLLEGLDDCSTDAIAVIVDTESAGGIANEMQCLTSSTMLIGAELMEDTIKSVIGIMENISIQIKVLHKNLSIPDEPVSIEELVETKAKLKALPK